MHNKKDVNDAKSRTNIKCMLAIRFGFAIILAHGIRRIISIDTVFYNHNFYSMGIKSPISYGEVGEWLKPVPC